MKRHPEFKDNDYSQQANSLKMTINWIPRAVRHHVVLGRQQRKKGVTEYPAKVIRQLELIIERLRTMR